MRKVVLPSLCLIVLVIAYFGWQAFKDRESARQTNLGTTIVDAQKAASNAKERAESWIEHGNIRFREIACKAHPKDAPPRVAASAWDGDVLAIKAPICINCAQNVDSVAATVDGDKLSLTIKPTNPDVRTACDCERLAEIRIGALPKRDYKILGVEPVDVCI